jgi:cobalt-zinc-cadmium efflux system protein
MEILAAFINGLFLALLSCAVIWGAWTRYHHPVEIKALEMGGIALAGLFFNLLGAWLLLKGDREHLNIRGALFHVLGDALGSVGAVVAAILVYFFHWYQADSVVSIVIAFIIIASAYRLILDTAHVILEGAPHHLDTDEIRKAISSIPLISEVHDLHVWSITSGMVSLSVHVVADDGSRHNILCEIRDMLKARFKIEHVTIQIEDTSLKSHEPQI